MFKLIYAKSVAKDLFDVNWKKKEIYVLKIGHRKNVY